MLSKHSEEFQLKSKNFFFVLFLLEIFTKGEKIILFKKNKQQYFCGVPSSFLLSSCHDEAVVLGRKCSPAVGSLPAPGLELLCSSYLWALSFIFVLFQLEQNNKQ